MYVRICVCVCVCMLNSCPDAYISTCMHALIESKNAHVDGFNIIYTHVCIHIYIHTYINTYIFMQ